MIGYILYRFFYGHVLVLVISLDNTVAPGNFIRPSKRRLKSSKD